MDLKTVKLEVINKLMSVSNYSLLDKINSILDKEMIVAYTVDGNPLTKEQYEDRLSLAEEQLLTGEYISQDDLEKESKNW